MINSTKQIVENNNMFEIDTPLNTITVNKFEVGSYHATVKWKINNNRIDESYVSEEEVFDWIEKNHINVKAWNKEA